MHWFSTHTPGHPSRGGEYSASNTGHPKEQVSLGSHFPFTLLAKTQQVAVALAPRLWPDQCYGTPHFRVPSDLTNSQGFSDHLCQIGVSSSNFFPATSTRYENAYGPLDRHLKCHRTVTNSASSLALTFPLLQSLKPPPFLTDT